MKTLNFDNLKKRISKEADIGNIGTLDSAIIVIGDTGVGKSTFINALIGKQLEAVYHGEGLAEKLVLNSLDDGPKIGHSCVSETTFIKTWKDQIGNTTYIDCPGFSDTRNIEQEIINAVLVRKVFTNIPYIKILLAISVSQITSERSKELISLITQLSQTFGDYYALKSNLGVIVTKASKSISTKSVRSELATFKQKHEASSESALFNDQAFSTLWDIVTNAPMAIFHNPTSEGPFNPPAASELMGIKDCLSFKAIQKFNIGISSAARVAVNQNYDFLVKNLKASIAELVSKVAAATEIHVTSGNLSAAKKLKECVEQIVNFDKSKLDSDNPDYVSYVEQLGKVSGHIGYKPTLVAYDIEMLHFIKTTIVGDNSSKISDIVIGDLLPALDKTKLCVAKIDQMAKAKEEAAKALEIQKEKEELKKQNELELASAYFDTANACYGNDNYSGAFESVSKAIIIFEKYSSTSYKYYELLGKCKIQLGHSVIGINEAFQKAASMTTNPCFSILAKGAEYAKCMKFDEAITAYNEALTLAETAEERSICHNRMGLIYHDKKSDYRAATDSFKAAYIASNIADDEAIYKSNEGVAWRSLASTTYNVDDKIRYYTEAIGCYETAYSKKSDQKYKNDKASCHYALGDRYYYKSNYQAAIEQYDKAYRATNVGEDEALYKSSEAHAWKCRAMSTSNIDDKIKYYQEAIKCYETAYQRKSDQKYKNSEAWIHDSLGDIYYGKEWWDSAYDQYKKAYDLSNISNEYKIFKDSANRCFGVFSGASGGRQKIGCVLEICYDNPLLNYPEIMKVLSKNLSMGHAKIIDAVKDFDKDFLNEVCLSRNIQLLQESIEQYLVGEEPLENGVA